jgi:hypothetical protein
LVHQRLLWYLLSPFIHDLALWASSRCLRSRRPQWLIGGVLVHFHWFLLIMMLFGTVSAVDCLHGCSHLASMPLFESESTNFAILLGHLDGTVWVLQLVPGSKLCGNSKLLVWFSSLACIARLTDQASSIQLVSIMDEWRLIALQLRSISWHAFMFHAYHHLLLHLHLLHLLMLLQVALLRLQLCFHFLFFKLLLNY